MQTKTCVYEPNGARQERQPAVQLRGSIGSDRTFPVLDRNSPNPAVASYAARSAVHVAPASLRRARAQGHPPHCATGTHGAGRVVAGRSGIDPQGTVNRATRP